jgi:hypothetical protein
MIAWRRAQAADVPGIVTLADQFYSGEVEGQIFTKSPTRLHYHLQQAILTQTYMPTKTCVLVAGNDTISAWSWLETGSFTPYSDDEMAVAEFLHIDLNLPARLRVDLIRTCLDLWRVFCREAGIPVLVSTTIRADQSAFMRLHERAGFTVRGSVAYLRISK